MNEQPGSQEAILNGPLGHEPRKAGLFHPALS